MKVWISNYRDHWSSPYTWFDYLFWWKPWSRCGRWTLAETVADEARERSEWVDRPDWCDRWADRLSPISRAIQWTLDLVHPRVTYVRIDRWDTWSMDHTLAMIVLPMLRQLQATKHGSPNVADEDVPEHLRSTAAAPKENEWDTDSNHHDRWDWVLGEMIHAFECKVDDTWEEQFHTGEIDIKWVPVDRDGNEVAKGEHSFYKIEHGPDHTRVCDDAGLKAAQDRMANGFRLFGKYYQSLWD